MKVIPIVSGGLDSVTMAHHLAVDNTIDALISFDYGQRHVKELEAARWCAVRLGVDHLLVGLGAVLGGMRSALTSDDVDVPDGHYAEESMKSTIVPGRNLLMIAAATAYAVDRGADAVAIGVHGGDHFIYPDCRPAFVTGAQVALNHGYDIALMTPFIDHDKTWIASRAADLGVPIEDTWSCYKGGVTHCGTCGTCVERREAFSLAGVIDPTPYASRAPLPSAP